MSVFRFIARRKAEHSVKMLCALVSAARRKISIAPDYLRSGSVSESEIVSRLRATRLLPVATVERAEWAQPLGRALVAGGIACLEVAFRTGAAAAAIREACLVNGLLVGAGTVLSPELAERAADAGAQFAVAPGLNEEVVIACRELGLPFFPGVATPTEIEAARRLGLKTLKVFPAAQLGGAGFLRAVSATYPDVGFIPTGGIEPDDVAGYLAVPSVVACGGSWLVTHDLLRGGRFDEVERLAREAVAAAA